MLYENFFLFWGPQISTSFCFDDLESTKISQYEPVLSQKYENGYRTKICNFTVTPEKKLDGSITVFATFRVPPPSLLHFLLFLCQSLPFSSDPGRLENGRNCLFSQ